MAKVRVYELAKEFGVESKVVMAKLQELGEFVRSASSTIEAPVVRKLTDALQQGNGGAKPAKKAAPGNPAPARPAAPKPSPAQAAKPAAPRPAAPKPAAAEKPAAPAPGPRPTPGPKPAAKPKPATPAPATPEFQA
ncbi:translation initiation factor IF-2 N-terminal domain-containing protein, partial [Streptomyces beihaiensis]